MSLTLMLISVTKSPAPGSYPGLCVTQAAAATASDSEQRESPVLYSTVGADCTVNTVHTLLE